MPVEVIPFGEAVCARALAALGCTPVPRAGFVTDEGNHILDCRFGPIADPATLATAIRSIPGVVEHGLFLGMAAIAYVAGADGVEIDSGSAQPGGGVGVDLVVLRQPHEAVGAARVADHDARTRARPPRS